VKTYDWIHCYTAQDIRAAYGVDQVANMGAGQTIVLMDSYGSPTAAQDLQHFHDVFFPSLPSPDFSTFFPNGHPDYKNVAKGNGQSGPIAAAGWSGEATLDIEWSYAIAPLAHIVLLAVPPAETEGVQGFPTLFRGMRQAIEKYPPGTIFSQSFGVTEQTFEGAQGVKTSQFDQVYQEAAAKGDTVLASSGDSGTTGVAKPHRDGTVYPYATVGWPGLEPVGDVGWGDTVAVRLDVGPHERRAVHGGWELQPFLLQLHERWEHRGGVERELAPGGHRRRSQRDLPHAFVAAACGKQDPGRSPRRCRTCPGMRR